MNSGLTLPVSRSRPSPTKEPWPNSPGLTLVWAPILDRPSLSKLFHPIFCPLFFPFFFPPFASVVFFLRVPMCQSLPSLVPDGECFWGSRATPPVWSPCVKCISEIPQYTEPGRANVESGSKYISRAALVIAFRSSEEGSQSVRYTVISTQFVRVLSPARAKGINPMARSVTSACWTRVGSLIDGVVELFATPRSTAQHYHSTSLRSTWVSSQDSGRRGSMWVQEAFRAIRDAEHV